MPLSQNHKKESQSIEDLIAQLDAPTNLNGENEQASNDATNNSNSNNGENNRKVIRGKRTTSLSSSGGGNNKANNNNGPTEYYDPVLQKNIMISKKYSKALRTTKGKGMPKKGGSGGKHTWFVLEDWTRKEKIIIRFYF